MTHSDEVGRSPECGFGEEVGHLVADTEIHRNRQGEDNNIAFVLCPRRAA
jgi:hypothetical protein